MTPPNNILQELAELESSLSPAALIPVYQAPAGYFEGLAEQVLRRVKALDAETAAEELEYLSPLLSQSARINPYTVPVGYFDQLEESLSLTIEKNPEEELELLSPLLSGLKKQNPYSVPDGYFENLQSGIKKNEVKEISGAKVIEMPKRSWLRYAAAAAVISFIAVGAFMFVNRNDERIDPSQKSFAWVEKNLKKVSTDDIDKFVEQAGEESQAIAKADSPDEIKSLLKDVSDKEIQDFLNDTQSTESETDDDLLLN